MWSGADLVAEPGQCLANKRIDYLRTCSPAAGDLGVGRARVARNDDVSMSRREMAQCASERFTVRARRRWHIARLAEPIRSNGDGGHRCPARKFLEFDHIVEVARERGRAI